MPAALDIMVDGYFGREIMESEKKDKIIYLFPVLYVIAVYLFPVLFFKLNGDEVQEATGAEHLNQVALFLPVIFGLINLIAVICFRNLDRIKFLRCMLIVKIGLIPFHVLGGLCIALALLFMFSPVVIMIAVGPAIAVTFSVAGWLILLFGSPYSITYLIKASREEIHPAGICVAAGVAQYFFVWDVASSIYLAIRERMHGIRTFESVQDENDIMNIEKDNTIKEGEVKMERVAEYLKNAGTYYLATMDGDQPRVRPFGTANVFEGKLYIQTGKSKDVSKQIHANPKVEICACTGPEWVRISATLVEDDRREARVAMLDAYPSLQAMYSPDDGNTEVFYLKDATATFCSFTKAPETVTF